MTIVPFVIGIMISVVYGLVMVLWGAHIQRHYGDTARVHRPTDDPHHHCDRHPIRCSHARTIDRYRDALALVAKCPNCHGCVLMAKAALATDYLPD